MVLVSSLNWCHSQKLYFKDVLSFGRSQNKFVENSIIGLVSVHTIIDQLNKKLVCKIILIPKIAYDLFS